MTANRDAFIDIWGPRIFRVALLDALQGGGRFSDEPFHVAITVPADDGPGAGRDRPTATELGSALAALGWRISALARTDDGWAAPDPSVEAVIVLDDACDIRHLPRRLITIGDDR